MEQTPIDLSRPWEHFSVETEEREMDQKMIKVIEGMPADVQGRFKGLYMLSNQCTTIGDQMDREMEAMEVAFLAKKKPIFEKREGILSGEDTEFAAAVATFDACIPHLETIVAATVAKMPADEKAEYDEATAEHEAEFANSNPGADLPAAGVPDFWAKAIKENEMLMSIIKEKDQEALDCITKLEVAQAVNPEAGSKKSKSVTLRFSDNEFFSNDALTMTCYFKDNDCEEVARVESTVVDWKDGKDLSKKKVKKKQKHKKTGETRTVTKTVAAESVFTCFQSFKVPNQDDQDSDEEPDEEERKLIDLSQECMTLVEDMATTFEEALLYYFGLGTSMEEMMANAGYDPEMMKQMMEGAGEGDDEDMMADMAMAAAGCSDEDDDGEVAGDGYVPQSKFGATSNHGNKKKK